MALALKAWNLLRYKKERSPFCPFIDIVKCAPANDKTRRNGKGICHIIFDNLAKHKCGRIVPTRFLVDHSHDIERGLWIMADRERDYADREQRMKAAAEHGFKSITESVVEMYLALGSVQHVSIKLDVSLYVIYAELLFYGVNVALTNEKCFGTDHNDFCRDYIDSLLKKGVSL